MASKAGTGVNQRYDLALVTVDGETASISAFVHSGGEGRVGVKFARTVGSTYPVACLSAYKDLSYELRDEAGRLIAEIAKTLAHLPEDLPGLRMHVTGKTYRHGAGRLPRRSYRSSHGRRNARGAVSALATRVLHPSHHVRADRIFRSIRDVRSNSINAPADL